jgi:uracil-DNA glycosylase family 4
MNISALRSQFCVLWRDMEISSETTRAMRQMLESVQRAGVTHLRASGLTGPVAELEPLRGVAAATPVEHLLGSTSSVSESVPTPAASSVTTLSAKSAATPPRSLLDAAGQISSESALSPEERLAQLQVIQTEVAACTRCSELASTRTQTVFGVGNPGARLVFVGEAPGADEDAQGEPFVGRAGQLLTDIITKGMKLHREDVYILNVLKCRPPGNRNPAPNEVINCRGFLDRQLEVLQPEFLCCLGAIAAKAILNTEQSIGRLRGKFHDYRGIPVLCTYHPAYLLRNPAAKKEVWEDIQVLMKRMGLGL